MKLVIQIPCLNEEATIAEVLHSLPRSVEGFDTVETVVVDDGSTDKSATVAKEAGATEVVCLQRHMGLAAAFSAGVKAALRRKADVLVNTDADLQYPSEYIPSLVKPILDREADISIGDRLSHKPAPFGPVKMLLERLGSWFVRDFAGVPVNDAASGFRAFSREAMQFMFVHGKFSYTLETLVMAGMRNLRIVNVPIHTNKTKRKSRLVRSIPRYITQSVITVIRAYLMYHPLKFFVSMGMLQLAAASVIGIRFLYYFFATGGGGHVQSLILLAILAVMGFLSIILGLIGDVVAANRRLLEDIRKNSIRDGVR